MLSIVVPTYKEALNLRPLVESIDEVMSREGIIWDLIIADDNSPDDTLDVAESLAREYPVRVLRPVGRDRDLSLSVLDGIGAAKFDNVVVMDADLSHPPERIPEMLAYLTDDPTAFVVGSRYVEGGSFDRDWSFWRFLNSYLATLLARPLVRCSDPMSGFFALNRNALGDSGVFNPLGYKIGLELMVRGDFSGVREVPIQFRDRELGSSKMDISQQLKYMRHLRRLYLHRFGSLARFVH
ncbi:MAG: polyprenol monophosphomannose synthase, partial [Pseudomonadales bacterium]|nr:polyprenol monophosphomannose synthase [Pseudomonadales bacterium]